MIFKNESGEIVTPHPGDKFKIVDGSKNVSGMMLGDVVTFVTRDETDPEREFLMETPCERHFRAWFRMSDLEPLTGPTLFEAAKDAPDGTVFKVGLVRMEKIQDGDSWGLHYEHGENVRSCVLGYTNFEIIPPGPKKRDCDVTVLRLVGTLSAEVPDDMLDQCVEAFDLIARLCMWEGAQIGKPGYMVDVRGNVSFVQNVTEIDVTFKDSAEQAIAAWKAECPEMFK